jgi:protein SCO1
MSETTPAPAKAAPVSAREQRDGLPRMLWVLIALAALFASAAAFAAFKRSRRVELPVLAEVPAFAMRDQAGRPMTPAELRGAPFIADFIFLSCRTSCPKLTARMKQLHDRIAAKRLTVKLVSITVDPENDGPEQLATYASRNGADPKIWSFLTGPIEQLDPVVVKGFKVQYEKLKPIDPDTNLFNIMHGDWFVLVDGQGRIRGYYDTNDPEKLDAVLDHAEILARYPGR